MLKIEEGKKYLCIKSVYMRSTGVRAFTEGKVYTAIRDEKFLNDNNNSHYTGDDDGWNTEHFAEVNPVYYITIIDRISGTTHNLLRNKETIEATIEKELGGWDNLYSAMTSGSKLPEDSYCMAGSTKDGLKQFSILYVI